VSVIARRATAALALAAAVTVGVQMTPSGAATCVLPAFGPGRSYQPLIDPTRFGPNVDNPWYPLTPGRVDVYVGEKDGKRALDVVAPSTRTRVIDGVTTRVVEDRLYLDAVLAERTADYYAQDDCGNVWYFGEDTAELNAHGKVTNRGGSFHSGVHGGQPGVFMPANPAIGRQFRQEWSPGQAEDRFTTLSTSAHISVPAGSWTHALRTKEATDLEPGTLDNKVYVRGVGEVVENAVKGPMEKLVLVEVID